MAVVILCLLYAWDTINILFVIWIYTISLHPAHLIGPIILVCRMKIITSLLPGQKPELKYSAFVLGDFTEKNFLFSLKVKSTSAFSSLGSADNDTSICMR